MAGVLTQAITPTGAPGPAGSTASNRATSPTPTTPTTTIPTVAAPAAPTMPTITASTGGTAANMGTGVTATANNAQLTGGMNDQTTNAATNINAIAQSNSPLMQQAQGQANAFSAGRGLLNSSIGAGNSESAMLTAATPLAEQNASTAAGASMQNAQLQTQAGEFSASQQQQAAAQNASLAQQQAQFGAGQTQAAATTNAQMTAAAAEQTQSIQATLANTQQQGLDANTLATIQGNVSLGIAGQQSTNALLAAASNGINAVVSNPNMSAGAAQTAIAAIKANLGAGLAVTNIIQGGTPTSDPWNTTTYEGAVGASTSQSATNPAPTKGGVKP